jgi:hypothetical protein
MSLILQAAFGRRHTRGARVDLDRHSERAPERFESGFGLMVRVGAAEVVDVQGHVRVINEALEEFMNQIDVELPDARACKIDVEIKSGPTGQVDNYAGQCFIERDVSVAVSAHAFLVTYRFGKRLAKRDADVLNRVMRIDVKIAARFDFEIEQAMPRDLVKHVIEKRNLRREAGAARAVEVQPHIDLCLQGVATDLRITPAHIGSVHAERRAREW